MDDISKAEKQISKKYNVEFPVVGIGASAGGLEALETFFKCLPADPGASFIVVQHLSPDYKSLMDELLARHTRMKINVVKDGVTININQIYLIPPKKNMTIFNGQLFLTDHDEQRKLNLPIDIFFRSLAKDQEKNAIAIIMSGTGTDGTLGIRAIKEMGGTTMVQSEDSAKFDGMPRSSISTGLVDYILPPQKLAEELLNYIKHPFVSKNVELEELLRSDQNQLSKVIGILRDAKNLDFSSYKENTIIRRLEKRISINRYNKIDDYVSFLANNNREIDVLFNDLLIGVTRFFRDEAAYKNIEEKVIPALYNRKNEIRIWVGACSTGEEAYSLAILLREYMVKNKIHKAVKIFATDIDAASLDFAASGFYPDNIASDVSSEYLTKHFIKKEQGYQVNEKIRGMIVFAKHNLLNDPPFSKMDLISCRNVLIYLNNDVQQKVLSTFYVSLVDNGFLFLGSSESLGNVSDGFKVIEGKHKIFQKQAGYKPTHIKYFGLNNQPSDKSRLKNNSVLIGSRGTQIIKLDSVFEQALDQLLPPSVLINNDFEVCHIFKDVKKYLSIPSGQASLNILKMLNKDHALIVSSLKRRCEKKEDSVVMENIQSDDPESILSISCKRYFNQQSNTDFYIVSFHEIESKKERSDQKVEKVDFNAQYQERIDELERQLQHKSENLQATVEELETSNEELQSSNEELIASNEELQSTNEELQSVNEELYTVNSEHILKIEELTELNADMDNLLKNTRIGNIFLDRNQNIRKINDVATALTDILPGDVGRPIFHLSLKKMYSEFLKDIETVIKTLKPIEKEIRSSEDINWFLMRIIPYRTKENAVEGTIITFIEITKLKESQLEVVEMSNKLNNALNLSKMTWWFWDYKANMVTAGDLKYEMLGYKKGQLTGEGFETWTKLIHPEDSDKAMKAMKNHLEGKAASYFVEYRIKHKNGNYIRFLDKGGIIERDKNGKPTKLAGMVSKL